MARMPRGEPRSVPDPVGEQYDEMIRQERLRQQRGEDAKARATALIQGAAGVFPSNLPDFNHQPDQRGLSILPDGRPLDPRCVVAPDTPLVSPAELAEQKRAIQRAFFMTDSPLGAAAYGVAALSGASPQVRDGGLIAGGALDTFMQGAAPMGAPIRGRAAAPQAQPAAIPLDATVRLRERNVDGQPMGMNAAVTRAMLGTGTRIPAWLRPPGYEDDAGHARGHLLGRQLGGEGKDRRNAVTLTQNPTNSPDMRDFENMVARRAQAGEVVEYSVTPLYNDGILPPGGMLLTAHGSRSGPRALFIQNPAGQRR
jgi:hypothetical protein